jgi:mannonate dehydratase
MKQKILKYSNICKKGTFSLTVLLVAGFSSCNDQVESNSESAIANSETNSPESQIQAMEWPMVPGEDSPKLSVGISSNATVEEMRRAKQIGADYVLMGGPPIPWTEEGLREIMDRFEAEELTVINMMIGGYDDAIFGREGRDQQIEDVKASLRAAGAVGLPVVEYNWYADRFMKGYHEVIGRGGAGMTGFDYNYQGAKDLPLNPERGEAQTAEMLWNNITYFLEAVIPVAEEAGVRMALHPNDPPVPVSKGHAQIMRTFDDWKRLLDIVDSPSNGMTYHNGVSIEAGADPLEVMRYMGERDRLNHWHYRNVISEVPFEKYTEVFPDEGQIDMLAIMEGMYEQGYNRGVYPEHPRALTYDKEHPDGIRNGYPGGGGYAGLTYNVAYTKAMMQAVMTLRERNK